MVVATAVAGVFAVGIGVEEAEEVDEAEEEGGGGGGGRTSAEGELLDGCSLVEVGEAAEPRPFSVMVDE